MPEHKSGNSDQKVLNVIFVGFFLKHLSVGQLGNVARFRAMAEEKEKVFISGLISKPLESAPSFFLQVSPDISKVRVCYVCCDHISSCQSICYR